MHKSCPLHTKNAHHDPEFKKRLTHRLARIEGQIRGISRMVAEDVYCDDVLNQITSIQAALNGVKKGLLEAHIKSCVVEQLAAGESGVVDELIMTIGKMLK